ncbi:MAG: ATP-dependent DNA helicase [Bacteroides sp. SM23_62_1]|nr:MAG: ATP-dependent DNA helicase [Bacteroides sp. SM23_62_1]
MSRYIRQLISQGEGLTLDFKYEISDARKIARTLIAFSNTEGGKLLIGVKDNGNITGIQSEEEYHMIEAAAQLYCKPEVHFLSRKWDINGKTILEIDIPKAEKRPYFALSKEGKWLAYVRIKDQNILATRVLLKIWEREKRKKGIYLKYGDREKILLDYLSMNQQVSLSKFCRIAKIPRRKAEDILVNLVLFEVIEMAFDENAASYHLKK